ncbi:MAG TPA: DMT family transporter [Gemmatimonadaceae bacterium]
MPHTAHSHPISKTDGLLLVMTTIWAVNFSVTKYATTAFEPRAFAGLRVALAAVVLVGLTVVTRAPIPERRVLLKLLAIGVIGHGVYQLLFIEGLARTRAGNAALIVAASPAVIALFGRYSRIERVRGRAVAGLALSFLGVAAIVLGSATAAVGESSMIGTLLICTCVLCWTGFTLTLQPYAMTMNPLTLATTTIIGGLIPLLVFSGPALARTRWDAVPPQIWPAVFYSSVMAMVVAYLFWYRGVRVLGPTRTAVYANVQPIIALLVAWFTLGEVPTVLQGIGAVTIVSGVFFTRM